MAPAAGPHATARGHPARSLLAIRADRDRRIGDELAALQRGPERLHHLRHLRIDKARHRLLPGIGPAEDDVSPTHDGSPARPARASIAATPRPTGSPPRRPTRTPSSASDGSLSESPKASCCDHRENPSSLIRDTRARGQRLTLRDRPRHRRPTRSRVRRLGRRTRVPLGRRVTRCLGRPCKRGDWAGSDDCNLTRSERERASGRTTPDRPQRASAAPSSRRLLCGQRSRKRFGGSVIGERGAVGARHSPCRAGGRSRLKPPPWGRHAAGALRPPCARCRAGAARSGRRRPCRSDRGGCEHPSSRRCS